MDPRDNPYSPGAGTSPPVVTGRDDEIEQFEVMLSRLAAGRSARSMLVTGLRGVGKTVLLNQFEGLAQAKGWYTVQREVDADTVLPAEVARVAQRAFRTFKVSRRVRERVEGLLGGLTSFRVSMPEGIELTYEPRLHSGTEEPHLAEDLGDILLALGEAAVAKDRGVLILLDEAQSADEKHFAALTAGLHRVAQRDMPLAVVAAGLPQLRRVASLAKSYAERLFTFRELGRLSAEETSAALRIPAERQGVRFEPHALRRIVALTDGYPYFIQEYGSAVWNVAPRSQITRSVVDVAEAIVTARLDDGFFRLRLERAAPHERTYMLAMAELGDGPYRSGEVATALARPASSLSPTRDALIKKGLVYSPARGRLDFTVPQFAAYLRRAD